MQIVVLADALQKEELVNGTTHANFVWVVNGKDFLQHKTAGAFLDLTFVNTAERKALLDQLLPKPVVVNSVVDTLAEIHPSFIRINGWHSFLSSPVIEGACINDEMKTKAGDVFTFFNKRIEWLTDDAGFVAARVVSMMVNEAFLALAEGVSTPDEINTAMKFGTAYPYGPFEWAKKIGVENIVALLNKLGRTQARYKPAALLVKECAFAGI